MQNHNSSSAAETEALEQTARRKWTTPKLDKMRIADTQTSAGSGHDGGLSLVNHS